MCWIGVSKIPRRANYSPAAFHSKLRPMDNKVPEQDVAKAQGALDEFDKIFKAINLQRDQHTNLATAVVFVKGVLARLTDVQGWAERYMDQCGELKATAVVTALDNGIETSVTL